MSFNDPDGRCARRIDGMFCVPKYTPRSKAPPKPAPRRPFHGVSKRAIENKNVRPKSTPNKRATENQNVRGPNAPVYAGGFCVAFCGSGYDKSTPTAEQCIVQSWCNGHQLTNAIQNSDLGGGIFDIIDVAHQGNVNKVDGNWNPKDLAAAVKGTNLAAVVEGFGLTGADAAAMAAVAQSVAERLVNSNALYEQIDHEQSFLQRNSTLVSIAKIGLSVAAIGGCVLCGVAVAGISTLQAIDTCTDERQSGASCGVAIGFAVVDTATASAGAFTKFVAPAGAKLLNSGAEGLANAGHIRSSVRFSNGAFNTNQFATTTNVVSNRVTAAGIFAEWSFSGVAA